MVVDNDDLKRLQNLIDDKGKWRGEVIKSLLTQEELVDTLTNLKSLEFTFAKLADEVHHDYASVLSTVWTLQTIVYDIKETNFKNH